MLSELNRVHPDDRPLYRMVIGEPAMDLGWKRQPPTDGTAEVSVSHKEQLHVVRLSFVACDLPRELYGKDNPKLVYRVAEQRGKGEGAGLAGLAWSDGSVWRVTFGPPELRGWHADQLNHFAASLTDMSWLKRALDLLEDAIQVAEHTFRQPERPQDLVDQVTP